MRFTRTAVLAACSLLVARMAQAAPASPEGHWLSGNGNVEVAIAPCGPALCGTIVKVLANRSMDGGSAPMAPRPGVGLKIMTGFRADGPDRWVGRLYDRENGRTYDCELSMQGRERMTVRGYLLLPLIGKTQIWRRVE